MPGILSWLLQCNPTARGRSGSRAARRLGMTARDEVAFPPDKRPAELRPATLLTIRPLV
jgi:hypothetical protein